MSMGTITQVPLFLQPVYAFFVEIVVDFGGGPAQLSSLHRPKKNTYSLKWPKMWKSQGDKFGLHDGCPKFLNIICLKTSVFRSWGVCMDIVMEITFTCCLRKSGRWLFIVFCNIVRVQKYWDELVLFPWSRKSSKTGSQAIGLIRSDHIHTKRDFTLESFIANKFNCWNRRLRCGAQI